MYRIKHGGKDGIHIFDPENDAEIEQGKSLRAVYRVNPLTSFPAILSMKLSDENLEGIVSHFLVRDISKGDSEKPGGIGIFYEESKVPEEYKHLVMPGASANFELALPTYEVDARGKPEYKKIQCIGKIVRREDNLSVLGLTFVIPNDANQDTIHKYWMETQIRQNKAKEL